MPKQTLRHLCLDLALTLGFLLALKPWTTGLAVHEWLGIAVGVGIGVHAWLHRRWIAGVTRRLASCLPGRTRLYYALDATLLLAFTLLIGSGLAISQAALPALGISPAPTRALATAHAVCAWVTLGLLALKLAFHWRWFARALTVPPRGRTQSAPPGRRLSRRWLLVGGGALCALTLLGRWRWREAQEVPPVADAAKDAMPTNPTDVPSPVPATGANAATPALLRATAEPTAEPTATAMPAPSPQPVTLPRCPYGLVNDPYPGRCRRYVDRNGTGYCDLSESA